MGGLSDERLAEIRSWLNEGWIDVPRDWTCDLLAEVDRLREERDEGAAAVSELPKRVVIDTNGAYWRDFGTHYSICPVSEDNEKVEVVAAYERAVAGGAAILQRSITDIRACGAAWVTETELEALCDLANEELLRQEELLLSPRERDEGYPGIVHDLLTAQRERDEALAQAKTLREAITFYADEENWEESSPPPGSLDGVIAAYEDAGVVARLALAASPERATPEDVCAHGCGDDATVQHADGRLLCYPCYRVETGGDNEPPADCPTCSATPEADVDVDCNAFPEASTTTGDAT